MKIDNLTGRPLNIVFLHPELVIGGAERVILQAAHALQKEGHKITICAKYADPAFRFGKIHTDIQIEIIGGWRFFQTIRRPRAFRALAHAMYTVISLAWRGKEVDLFISDLIPHIVPFTKWAFPKARHLLYCHFPDQLLTKPRSGLYSAYRWPIDLLEKYATERFDSVLVNSKFTRVFLSRISPDLPPENIRIVYPGVAIPDVTNAGSFRDRRTILSIGRFRFAKNHLLAVQAFAELLARRSFHDTGGYRLFVAGGYTDEVIDVRQCFIELTETVDSLGLGDRVTFARNLTDEELESVWADCAVLVYPPVNEHFGIVPVEAMMRGIPVVAANSGGPLETVLHSETGFLCDANPVDFADAIEVLLANNELADKMGRAGQQRAVARFSEERFEADFVDAVRALF